MIVASHLMPHNLLTTVNLSSNFVQICSFQDIDFRWRRRGRGLEVVMSLGIQKALPKLRKKFPAAASTAFEASHHHARVHFLSQIDVSFSAPIDSLISVCFLILATSSVPLFQLPLSPNFDLPFPVLCRIQIDHVAFSTSTRRRLGQSH